MCQREAARHEMNTDWHTTPVMVSTKGSQTKRRTEKAASIQKEIIKSDPPVEVDTSQGSVSHIVPLEPADNAQLDEEETKGDKELMELAQALEEQLPDELRRPTTPVICPLQPKTSLKEFVSKMGDEFVKCSL